jgi:hypothetical protein
MASSAEAPERPFVIRLNGYAERSYKGMLAAAGASISTIASDADANAYRHSGTLAESYAGDFITATALFWNEHPSRQEIAANPNIRSRLAASTEQHPHNLFHHQSGPMSITNKVDGPDQNPASVLRNYVEADFAFRGADQEISLTIFGLDALAEAMNELRSAEMPAAFADRTPRYLAAHVLLPSAWEQLSHA